MLREERPRWGKDKLAVILRKEGWQVSTSVVGRILSSLKARGVLREPPANGISARKRQRPRPYAVRKPNEYRAREPGDIVEPYPIGIAVRWNRVPTQVTSDSIVFILMR